MCRSVHKVTPPAGDGWLLALFRSLPDLPPEPELRYTAAMTISDYADWLGATFRSGKGQDVLPLLLQMLVAGPAGYLKAHASSLKNSPQMLAPACCSHFHHGLSCLMLEIKGVFGHMQNLCLRDVYCPSHWLHSQRDWGSKIS